MHCAYLVAFLLSVPSVIHAVPAGTPTTGLVSSATGVSGNKTLDDYINDVLNSTDYQEYHSAQVDTILDAVEDEEDQSSDAEEQWLDGLSDSDFDSLVNGTYTGNFPDGTYNPFSNGTYSSIPVASVSATIQPSIASVAAVNAVTSSSPSITTPAPISTAIPGKPIASAGLVYNPDGPGYFTNETYNWKITDKDTSKRSGICSMNIMTAPIGQVKQCDVPTYSIRVVDRFGDSQGARTVSFQFDHTVDYTGTNKAPAGFSGIVVKSGRITFSCSKKCDGPDLSNIKGDFFGVQAPAGWVGDKV